MRKLDYQVTFHTPAFLGNAEQDGQWRTPPFKALLRQWWRVAYAADHGYEVDLQRMRREEGRLFGNAWLSHREGSREVADHCKSKVRLRLSHWGPGRIQQWPRTDLMVTHPEVRNHQGQTVAIGSQLYLGFGPLVARGRATTLKGSAAIQVGETAKLSVAVPDEGFGRIRDAFKLASRYGALGGRSRNGWGSVSLDSAPVGDAFAPGVFLRPWRDALELDWPHAIGEDESGPLIWRTAAFDDEHWNRLMRDLAEIKIGLRTQGAFRFHSGNFTREPEARHWLSHPVTRHNVGPWRQGRLPNSLRFKVRPDADDPRKIVGVIFHTPCLPPSGFHPDRVTIESVWERVHAFLDAQGLSRIPD